jgi:geranyl-CoA carboxylase alpha subunit
VDAQMRHYFLEMNTRLQVEHTVTECITGLDLVEWQLRVAQGEALPLQQSEISFSGHAIEARLYAEDPYDQWRPQTGSIVGWRPERAGIRVDHGIAKGGEVTPYYDAMVAKFIAHGHDRDDAIRRLTRALAEAPLLGLRNNGRFLADLINAPEFTHAQMHTTLLDDWSTQGHALLQRPVPSEEAWALAAAVLTRQDAGTIRPDSVSHMALTLICDGVQRTLQAPPVDMRVIAHNADELRYVTHGVQRRALAVVHHGTLHLSMHGHVFSFSEASPYPATSSSADPTRARAPVAGVVSQVAVQVGDVVSAGQPLVCVEAMKMEMWLHAGAAGTVLAVKVKVKDSVASGAVLVELEISA